MATDPAAVAKSRRGRSKGQLPHVLSLIQLRLLAITCTLSVPFRMTLAHKLGHGTDRSSPAATELELEPCKG